MNEGIEEHDEKTSDNDGCVYGAAQRMHGEYDCKTDFGDPNFETQENVEIDWTQVSMDAEDMFKDTSTYEYGRDFHFYMEPNKKQIMLIWVVADDLPDDQIGTYAEDLIKGFNDVVHTQDFSIEMSGEDSYGGLWKQYALSYSIVPESDQDNEDAWFISGSYEAGADFKLPDTKELISKVKEKEAAGEYDTTEAEEETENAE